MRVLVPQVAGDFAAAGPGRQTWRVRHGGEGQRERGCWVDSKRLPSKAEAPAMKHSRRAAAASFIEAWECKAHELQAPGGVKRAGERRRRRRRGRLLQGQFDSGGVLVVTFSKVSLTKSPHASHTHVRISSA